MDRKEFLSKKKHLPDFLRGFHDQKDLFKSLHEWMSLGPQPEDTSYKMPTWVEGHIYVMDYVLPFLALHGWTLQKTKSKITGLCDLNQTLQEHKQREAEQLQQMLNSFKNPDAPIKPIPSPITKPIPESPIA